MAFTDPSTVNTATTFTVPGLSADDQELIWRLQDIWRVRTFSNTRRGAYYRGAEPFRDLGIGIPPKISAAMKSVTSWPRKAVDAMADLVSLDGLSSGDPASDSWLDGVAARSALASRIPQIATSALTHGCAFLTLGFDSDGNAVLTPRSALWSAGVWDTVHDRLAAALTIDAVDKNGNVTRFTLWSGTATVTCDQQPGTRWAVTSNVPNPLGRPLAFAMVASPTLDRPLGKSRISHELMTLTDAATRTVARMETSAEFFAAPHVWLVGTASDFDIGSNRWSALQNAINAISVDDNGNAPQLQTVSQASMVPHTTMLESLALLAAADTDIPPEALGVNRSNPTSADALAAMERRLTRKADRLELGFERSIIEAVTAAAQLTGFDLKDPQCVWEPTREVSIGARTDAFQKIASVAPGFTSTRAAWRALGLKSSDVDEILRAVKARETSDALSRLFSIDGTTEGDETPAIDGASTPENPPADKNVEES